MPLAVTYGTTYPPRADVNGSSAKFGKSPHFTCIQNGVASKFEREVRQITAFSRAYKMVALISARCQY